MFYDEVINDWGNSEWSIKFDDLNCHQHHNV